MPETTPKPIAEYQGDTYCCDLKAVSEAIRLSGRPMMPGQYLFHGGKWPAEYKYGAMFETTRPLSTTLCPNIAMGVPQWHDRHIVIMQLNYLYFGLVNHIQKFFL